MSAGRMAETMAETMKVLVVLAQPPLPEGGAPGRCAVGLLRGLVAHGVHVTALAARRSFSIPGQPPTDLPVRVIDVPPEPAGWRSRLHRLRMPAGDLARSTEFTCRIREAARDVDVVHLDETETTWCADGIGVPSLIHMHYRALLDRSLGWPWRRQFRQVLEFAAAERAAMRRHRYIVANSPVVARSVERSARRAEVFRVPLCLDPAYYPRASLDGPPIAGIIGTAAWAPSGAAIMRLVRVVWPEVRRRVPEARLMVAGRGTTSLAGLFGPGVEVVGEVPRAAELFARMSVLIYPIERGSGMKVKVLESMASGVPVVTTPSGAEGVQSDGVMVEVDHLRLAEGAAQVLRDPVQRREMGAAARRDFERRFTPERAVEPLIELYRRMQVPCHR
jgi:glycosyltransferase involved in cell wall biosynthesis